MARCKQCGMPIPEKRYWSDDATQRGTCSNACRRARTADMECQVNLERLATAGWLLRGSSTRHINRRPL